MINLYFDPGSYRYLDNKIFEDNAKYHGDDFFLVFRYLKERCEKEGININTIDLWKKDQAKNSDVYFCIDHKSFLRRVYWHFRKNRKYPIFGLNKFSKKILFQWEPPIIMPDVYSKINKVIKQYNKAHFIDCANFTNKDKNLNCGRFIMPQSYNEPILKYWNNTDRKFLIILGTNKSAWPFKKVLSQLFSDLRFTYLGYKELFSERIKIIDFFSKYKEIDLYGNGWNKAPFFPYWNYKKSVQKVWKGSTNNRLEKLSEYKFSIVLENSAVPGWITERIFDSFYSGNVPVYLGAPDIESYIPKNCFIDMRDFKNYEDLRKFLKSLNDQDVESYRKNIKEFLSSEKFKPFSKEYFAEKIIEYIK